MKVRIKKNPASCELTTGPKKVTIKSCGMTRSQRRTCLHEDTCPDFALCKQRR